MVACVAGVASQHSADQAFGGVRGNFWLCRNIALERAVLWDPGRW